MTKIWLFSDLHTEISGKEKPLTEDQIPDADYLVIAGDYGKFPHCDVDMLQHLLLVDMPIIFVAGNHEHYKSSFSISEGISLFKAFLQPDTDFFFLENETKEFIGIRFIGATLWTDYNLYGDRNAAMLAAQNCMNDFRLIKGEKYPFIEPKYLMEIHKKSIAYIDQELSKPFEGKTVVVTHHLPSHLSVNSRYGNDALNASFASEVGKDLMTKANLWIHGHTHMSCDYTVSKDGKSCRVVCNPAGYLIRGQRENKSFNPNLVVEI